jgi:lysozyme
MPETNAVIDLSHFNQKPNLAAAKADGILGVIHKATQGTGYTDLTYSPRREQALAAGLLWGAYHFGTGADGVEQADYFLRKVQPTPGTLLVLDFEANPQGPSMSLEQGRAFVRRIQTAMGRWPGLYAGAYLKELLGSNRDAVLGNCWFWLSQYGPEAVVPANWKSWTMWQYTDGAAGPGPRAVAGIGACDRDKFSGTADELLQFWK